MRRLRVDKVKGLVALASLLVLSGAIVVVFSTMGKARTGTDVYAQRAVPTSTMIRGPISPLPTPTVVPTPTHPVAPPTPTWSPPPVLGGPGAIDLGAYFRDDGVIWLYRFAGGDKLTVGVRSPVRSGAQYWSIDPDGKNKQRLSELDAAVELNVTESFWYSPDGRKIAFEKKSPKSSELWVVDSQGKNPTRVAAQPDMYQQFAAWSPDSSKMTYLSYAHMGRTKSVWVVNADGNEARQIVAPTGSGIRDVIWSPDSSKVVLLTGIEDSGDTLFVVNADGTNMRAIGTFADPAEKPGIRSAVWSPDGRQILFTAIFQFTSPRPHFDTLWTASIEEGAPKSLASELSSTPIWLPNGKIRYVTIDQPNKKYVVKEIDPETRSSRSLLDFPRETDKATLFISATWATGGEALIASPMADKPHRLVKLK